MSGTALAAGAGLEVSTGGKPGLHDLMTGTVDPVAVLREHLPPGEPGPEGG